MRLHIIQPTHFAYPFERRLYKTRKRRVVPLTLPYLAALMPAGVKVVLTDEQVQTWDPELPCDCVFLTVSILNSLRAYEIADHYRKRGVPVVMGGPHCTFYGEECLEHADAIAVGEGESLVRAIVEDAASKKLQRIYRADTLHSLRDLPMPRYDLLDPRTLARYRTYTVQTSRGCPYRCSFCAERYYLGERYRLRPIEEVVEEIRRTRCRSIFFADSTFPGNRTRTLRLLEALIPLKIRWSALWNADRVLDRELMLLTAKSGALHLNMGVESIRADTLRQMNKKTTPVERLGEIIATLHRLDISFSFNLIFGWDTDRIEDFEATLDFLEKHKVPVAFFNVFSPHRGTEIYEKYRAAGRLRDEANMGRWPGIISEVHPAHFSAEELEKNVVRLYRRFYSFRSMLRRLPMPKSRATLASWFMNLGQRKMIPDRNRRTNFDGL